MMKTCEGCVYGEVTTGLTRPAVPRGIFRKAQAEYAYGDLWRCWRRPGRAVTRDYMRHEPAPPACRYFEEDAPSQPDDARIGAALSIARGYGQFDGGHHKAWAIDQMCRALLGEGYAAFVSDAKAGEDGPETYGWDEGIAP